MSAFACRNCLIGVLRAVLHDATTPSTRLGLSRSSQARLSKPHRRAHTAAAVASRHDARSEQSGSRSGTALAAPRELSAFKRSHMEKELKYLGDPLKFAANTKELLAKGQGEKALELTRLAGRESSVVVSWNHILNNHFKHGKVKEAWHLFNEMKKRDQKPDAYTYGIMLKGMGDNVQVPSAFGRALTIYQSMYAPNAPVKPTLLHTNAVLQVCAKSKALDNTFEIAAKLPDKGPGAPDNFTFTIILNAINASATDDILRYGKGNERLAMERYEEAAIKAKRIWRDVIRRWTDGSLMLDEKLVCAMGRILLLKSKDNRTANLQDNDDILSLFEQAMGIPRQVPKFKWREIAPREKDSDQSEAQRSLESHQSTGAMNLLDQGSPDDENQPLQVAEKTVFNREDSESIFDAAPFKDSQPRAYARPGRNTLSLIMVACGHLRELSAATAYWNLLRDFVEIDRENCHSYLRVLRVQRASRQASELVDQMLQASGSKALAVGVEKKTFRIAMSTFARNSDSPVSLNLAMKLFEQMLKSLEVPDIGTASTFAKFLKGRVRETDSARYVKGLNLLYDSIEVLRNVSRFGDFSTNTVSVEKTRGTSRNAAMIPGDIVRKVRTTSVEQGLDPEFANSVLSATERALTLYSEDMSEADRKSLSKKSSLAAAIVRNSRLVRSKREERGNREMLRQ